MLIFFSVNKNIFQKYNFFLRKNIFTTLFLANSWNFFFGILYQIFVPETMQRVGKGTRGKLVSCHLNSWMNINFLRYIIIDSLLVNKMLTFLLCHLRPIADGTPQLFFRIWCEEITKSRYLMYDFF